MRNDAVWGKAAALPVAVTVLIIAVVWVAHLPLLNVGGISRYDEFLTLDRSLSFARTGEWFTVFSSNKPSFQKPPLQYWMTAGLIEGGAPELVALRLPSMVFALGMLGVTAWLARLLAPDLPWAMPLATFLLASSAWFWTYANSAMLDTGAAFFGVATLGAAIVALDRPRVWYLVALIVGIGALQKAPVGLMFLASALVALLIVSWATGRDRPQFILSPRFLGAAVIGCALVLAWPLLQSVLHGLRAARASHGEEMISRFAPDVASGVRGIEEIADLLITGEPWLRWPALAAVMVLPFVVRRPAAVMVTGVVLVYVLSLMLAGGTVYSRYTLTILPLLMAAMAVVLLRLRPSPWTALVVGGVLVVLNGGPLQVSAVRAEALQPATIAIEIGALRGLGDEITPEETLVYCRSIGALWPIRPGEVSVYASNGERFLSVEDLERDPDRFKGPFRGICTRTQIGPVESLMRGFAVTREEAGYVIWTAEGLR